MPMTQIAIALNPMWPKTASRPTAKADINPAILSRYRGPFYAVGSKRTSGDARLGVASIADTTLIRLSALACL